MADMLKLGPRLNERSIWDDGGKTEVVQIFLSYDEKSIRSIQFVYVVDGNVVRSETHGTVNKRNFTAVGFDYPSEYLVSVSGEQYYEQGLVSITFGTNKREYGPFGTPGDSGKSCNKFAYYFTPKSLFGGFHGSCGQWPNANTLCIGVYIKPVRSLAELDTTDGVSGRSMNSVKKEF